MIINIEDDILILHNQKLLEKLLVDKTTKRNIMWATDAYNEHGSDYLRNEEIKAHLITGPNSDIIKTRARKDMEQQFERTRQRAEVFTPLWICERMNNDAERFWFEDNVPTENDKEPDYYSYIDENEKVFKKYVDSKRLEITCGEAPYLVSRYDMATGEVIPVEKRIGLLDKKLQAIGRYAQTEEKWMYWTTRAYQSIFGYEFQGDNVLIARVNLMMTFDEYMIDRWKRKPTPKEKEKIANIVAWNIWQMDGLTYTIPCSEAEERYEQLDLFGLLEEEEIQESSQEKQEKNTQPYCRIYDWHNKKKSIEFKALKEGMHMKFDFIIGNPPYQSDIENKGDRANPLYDRFMDNCYEIASAVELIHPARFLFNAGQTPKSWNKKILSDEHFKVLFYEPKSGKVFPNTDIKGGVAISYRDVNSHFGAIGTFTAFEELNSIIRKVRAIEKDNEYLDSIVSSRGLYRFSEVFYEAYPEAKNLVGTGSGNMIVSNAFDKLTGVFIDTKSIVNEGEYIKIIGRTKNDRTWRYIKRDYVIDNKYIDSYNIIVPEANGTGAIGEILSTPLIGEPLIGATDTFISIGTFRSLNEAEAAFKYIKSKFARAMLGVNKVTQHNPKSVWRDVPLQDFNNTSDIDWSQSISDVDQQLYKKYGLSQEEIDFIESHVKEME